MGRIIRNVKVPDFRLSTCHIDVNTLLDPLPPERGTRIGNLPFRRGQK